MGTLTGHYFYYLKDYGPALINPKKWSPRHSLAKNIIFW